MRAVAHKEWGTRKEDIRALFIGYVRSIIDYAGGAWHTVVSETNAKKIEVEEHRGARAITGCYNSTPSHILMQEADTIPFGFRKKHLAHKLMEKCLRDDSNPNSELVNTNTTIRKRKDLQGRQWRSTASKARSDSNLDLYPMDKILKIQTTPPWVETKNINIYTDLIVECKKSEEVNILKEKVEKTAVERKLKDGDLEVWTDGSVSGKQTDGGAGAIIIHRNGNREEVAIPAGKHASSYHTEMVAINEALSLIKPKVRDKFTINVMTDNRGTLTTLKKGHIEQRSRLGNEIWTAMHFITSEHQEVAINLQWVPSHIGIPGNERADDLAKEGSRKDQADVCIPFSAAVKAVKRKCRDEWRADFQRKGGFRVNVVNDIELKRKEATKLAQVKSGHSKIAKAYQHRIGIADNPDCELCLIPETVEHIIFACPQWNPARLKVFGGMPSPPDAIEGKKLIAFLSEIGR